MNKRDILFCLGVTALAAVAAAIYDNARNSPFVPYHYDGSFYPGRPRSKVVDILVETELITVYELLKDYKADPKKAAAKYEDKVFRIVGLVGESYSSGYSGLNVKLVSPEYLPQGITPDQLPVNNYSRPGEEVNLEGVMCSIPNDDSSHIYMRETYEKSAGATMRCRIVPKSNGNSGKTSDVKKKTPAPANTPYVIYAEECVLEDLDRKQSNVSYP